MTARAGRSRLTLSLTDPAGVLSQTVDGIRPALVRDRTGVVTS
jgi:hypothetical protein